MIASQRVQFDLAMDYHEHAFQFDRVRFSQHARLAVDYKHLGARFREKGLYENALPHYNSALGILTGLYREEHLEVSYIYGEMGFVYSLIDDFEEAHNCKHKSLEFFLG
ncbi:unnamed protein product [Didymodactylos carnosus]|uniref:Tetratricopeptide repeat protein n=1 Tax=Didymodactylos carnosus TaxID=1234261 RepID=A0A815J1E1_9BILA|nr:unnamed protein product [Didymodactylos carnosus]CAF1578136.1 unnamed protein product [Didymodactylos carnosus]CAF4266103.1 unnamed protein product [Didymodactylos carnosus]CAF4376540.1 unnamed protein product [Didymodactylos carnosus]